MAHPIIETLYLGLLASSAMPPAIDSHHVEVGAIVAPAHVASATPRVVYDWAGRMRTLYPGNRTAVAGDGPMVGISEGQIERMTRYVVS
ncbi:MAG: hypothetical protein KDJ27_09970 [Gammaproteobacteria bacterium]|nr:hypothetical protein [Gammaproteobacteria bacterium]MCB1924056.1 hypothetical protein [Gammaproteobacteria bacterium]